MRKGITFIFSVFLGLPLIAQEPVPFPVPVDESRHALESYIRHGIAREYYSQFAVGIILRDHSVYSFLMNTKPDRPYRLASISKIFTAMMVMQLAEEGKVKLDDPVALYLPGTRIERNELGSDPVTVRHLLSHTAGLPDLRYYNPPFYSEVPLVKKKVPGQIYPAGRHYRYANYGYLVLGRLVEELRGAPLQECLKTYIYLPAALADAQASSIASGADGVALSLNDMSSFARLWLRSGVSVRGARVLTQRTCRRMVEEQLFIPPVPMRQYVGLGWRVQRNPRGVYSFFHIGGAGGVAAWIQFFPQYDCAVFYLGNPAEYTDEVTDHVFRMQVKLAALAGAFAGAPGNIADFEPTPPDESVLDRYAGVYRDPVSGVLTTVYREGGRLRVKNGRESCVLYPSTVNVFTGAKIEHTYDFVQLPGRDVPVGLATYYGFFERVSESSSSAQR